LAAANEAVAHVERMAQRAFQGLGDQPSADSTGAYALLAVLQAEANEPLEVFATIEHQRAHSLRLVLARNERDISRGMTAAERDAERQLTADVVTVRAQLDHEKALPKPNADRLGRLQQRLIGAVEQRSAQRQEMFTRLPDLRMWRGLAPAAGLPDIGKALGDREALVEFVIDDDDLLVLLTMRDSTGPVCRVYLTSVPRQTLAERVAHAVDPATLRDMTLWRQASAELMTSIPSGAWSAIAEASTVVVIPDDVLWRVPFEALPVDDAFLADRATIVYAGSATSLLHIPSTPSGSATVPMLAVASPDTPPSLRDRLQATAPGWSLRAADAADAEIQAIASVFDDVPPKLLRGSSATESAFRDLAGTAAIIHIAAPFRMNGASPLFSSMLLTPESAEGEPLPDKDGALEAREVMNLDLHGAVTVFSDGGSASMRGAASAADVVAWAWRAAGIPAIVLPRWTSDDRTSAALLKTLYVRLTRDRESPASALRSAATEIRASEATRAPYYWAAWQVVGR